MVVVAGLAAENGLRSCNWSATAAGWCRTQCGHHQLSCGADTQRRNAALLPRTGLNNVLLGRQTLACSRELRTGPPAPSPPLLPRAGVPRLGPGPGPEQRRRARCILGTPAPHPRPAAPLLYCQGLSSRLIIPSPAAGLGWGWGWMLKITKNKMLHFFADVHCTSKHTAACPPAPGRHTFVYMEAIRAECPD